MVDDDFDAFVAELDGAMVIGTTCAGGERAGCLIGFHSQCSIEPRRYAVWLSVLNRTYDVATSARYLAIHAVPPDRRDLAALFGGTTGDDVDKFAACSWTAGPDGVPLLDELPDRVILSKIAVLDAGGDHLCFIGAPVSAASLVGGGVMRLADVEGMSAGHPASPGPGSGGG